MEIDVTQEDIDRGSRRSPWSCPVQRATQRKLQRRVAVNTEAIIFAPEGFCFMLPDDVRGRIAAYDQGGPMEPFTFVMPTTGYKVSRA